jgi:outer membrane receptor protein involved in Fe transport
LYTATLTAKTGALEFTSISGYGSNKYYQVEDAGVALVPALPVFGFASSGASAVNEFETKKITQEFRVTSTVGQELEWLAGAFYSHEETPAMQGFIANDLETGASQGVVANFDEPSTVTEYALFGDLTIHFTDRFDVQFGGRESRNRQRSDETDSGPYASVVDSVSPFVFPTGRSEANAFTYLLTPRFKVSSDLMVYARLASGYRVGGPNSEAALLHVPLTYGPDKTNDYEVGVKGSLFDRHLTFDASAYYIAWRRIQLSIYDQQALAGYIANAGNAKSQGLEFSVQGQPARGLSITAAMSLDDAALTQDIPLSQTVAGSAGDPLPFSSRFSASLSVEQDIPLTGSLKGVLGASVSYVGAREGAFTASVADARNRFPAYAQTGLRAGIQYASWAFNLFANNIADKRGIIGGGNSLSGSGFDAIYIQPRTVGLSATTKF